MHNVSDELAGRLIQQRIVIFIKETEQAKDILEEVNEIYEEDLIEQVSRETLLPRMNQNRLSLIKEFIKHNFPQKSVSRIKSRVEANGK